MEYYINMVEYAREYGIDHSIEKFIKNRSNNEKAKVKKILEDNIYNSKCAIYLYKILN